MNIWFPYFQATSMNSTDVLALSSEVNKNFHHGSDFNTCFTIGYLYINDDISIIDLDSISYISFGYFMLKVVQLQFRVVDCVKVFRVILSGDLVSNFERCVKASCNSLHHT